MATVDDVRDIALSLPDVTESFSQQAGGAAWRVGTGLFAWERAPRKSDLAALEAQGRSWPDGPVIGIRTDGLDAKEALLASIADILFTIPHFDGYPAVLVRLDAVDRDQLAELVTDAWIVKAPKRVSKAWLAERGLTGE